MNSIQLLLCLKFGMEIHCYPVLTATCASARNCISLILVKDNSLYSFLKKSVDIRFTHFADYILPIESTKTTSMGDVSTGVLEKNIEYVRSKYKAKMIWCIKTYIIAYVKMKKIRIYYVKPTAQLVFKKWFPKDGPTCRRQVVNPRHQTSQGHSAAKPENPLQNIQVE